MEEIFKDIPGYEGKYKISNRGNVISLQRKKARLLSQKETYNGYFTVSLNKDGKYQKYRVHRLVGMVFLPNPEGKPEIDHINRNRKDNRVENLEWVTKEENNMRIPNKKAVKQFSLDGKFIKEWPSAKGAGRALNIDGSHIASCCAGRYNTIGGYIWKYAS